MRRCMPASNGVDRPVGNSTLLLIDGMAAVYRAYHSVRGLTSPDGRPTNALFGFIKAVGHLKERWKPSHIGVVFDRGKCLARLDILPEYKAQRPPMPDDLREQLPLINEYIEAAGLFEVRMDNEEADDIIATIVQAHRGDSLVPTIIATKDKDLMQLVSERVHLAGFSNKDPEIGPRDVVEKTGIRPDQIVDWLSIIGDNADNIPGLPGAGPKTAAKWLQQYETLECVMLHEQDIKPERFRPLIESMHADLIRNQRLIALRTELPLKVCLDDLKVRDPSYRELLTFLKTHGLKSIIRDVQQELDRSSMLF